MRGAWTRISPSAFAFAKCACLRQELTTCEARDDGRDKKVSKHGSSQMHVLAASGRCYGGQVHI